ncbi:MAG: zinc ribbon domain-containing protein [Ardenticatenales bacterium]|nr:zinc ribbon domain-containing protein [Ardenticatenales bacterium]
MRLFRTFISALCLLPLLVAAAPHGAAGADQQKVTNRPAQQLNLTLDQLQVEFWPDFDEPNVLILVTGDFPAGTNFPVTFTWPLPLDARVHVAARIDSSGQMIDDIAYQLLAGGVQITAPETRFRLEYYVPYEETDAGRSYTYGLPAGLTINSFDVAVQQPAAAPSITISPAPEMTQDRGDSLNYMLLPTQAVSPQDTVTITFSYPVGSGMLTTEVFSAPVLPTQVPQASSGISGSNGFDNLNWPLLIAGVAGLLVSFYFIGSGLREWRAQGAARTRRAQRSRPAPSRPRPQRQQQPAPRRERKPAPPARSAPPSEPAAAGAASFCHNCGAPIDGNDRFCRQCGTAIRGR